MIPNPIRGITNAITGILVLIAVGLAFLLGGGGFNLPIFFFVMAFVVIIGSLGTLRPRAIYGSFYGAMWMIMLALFFLTGSWLWFLVGAIFSLILSALMKPLLAALLGMGLFAVLSGGSRQPQQPYQQYQQPYQPYQQPYQQYQQGYQPPQQPSSYQEGGQQYQYPAQQQPHYEQPQTQYPQEMPPQQ